MFNLLKINYKQVSFKQFTLKSRNKIIKLN